MSLLYIKSMRALKDLNQADVAAYLGISLASFNYKENGKTPFTVKEIEMMAELFGVSFEVLYSNMSSD